MNTYNLNIRTCSALRKLIAGRMNIPLKDITVNKAATKIIVTVEARKRLHSFFSRMRRLFTLLRMIVGKLC